MPTHSFFQWAVAHEILGSGGFVAAAARGGAGCRVPSAAQPGGVAERIRAAQRPFRAESRSTYRHGSPSQWKAVPVFRTEIRTHFRAAFRHLAGTKLCVFETVRGGPKFPYLKSARAQNRLARAVLVPPRPAPALHDKGRPFFHAKTILVVVPQQQVEPACRVWPAFGRSRFWDAISTSFFLSG